MAHALSMPRAAKTCIAFERTPISARRRIASAGCGLPQIVPRRLGSPVFARATMATPLRLSATDSFAPAVPIDSGRAAAQRTRIVLVLVSRHLPPRLANGRLPIADCRFSAAPRCSAPPWFGPRRPPPIPAILAAHRLRPATDPLEQRNLRVISGLSARIDRRFHRDQREDFQQVLHTSRSAPVSA